MKRREQGDTGTGRLNVSTTKRSPEGGAWSQDNNSSVSGQYPLTAYSAAIHTSLYIPELSDKKHNCFCLTRRNYTSYEGRGSHPYLKMMSCKVPTVTVSISAYSDLRKRLETWPTPAATSSASSGSSQRSSRAGVWPQ